MSDKTWDQMDGWGKAWEVTKVVFGLAVCGSLCVLALSGGGGGSSASGGASYGGSGGSRGRGSAAYGGAGSGSVWTVGHGGKKGYGSWSSTRHR